MSIGRVFGADPPVEALAGIDLKIHAGEWVAVTGPSGSGKSTLLNVIGCLDRATTGRYRFAGIDIAELGDRRLAGLRARAIGFVFQSFHLLAQRSVVDNVMLAELYRPGPRRGRRQRAMDALNRVGLSHRAGFLPTRLSGGERQRVAIARALVGHPKLLLCDEPTGNLDSATTAAVVDVLRTLHGQGMTIAMITHEADVAEAAPRQVQIVDGRIVTDA